MPIACAKSTSGGKGNAGMFIERDPKVCAAGIPSAQPKDRVADNLQQYMLQDEVDALIHDAIIPPPEPRPLPRLRKPIPLDQRYAGAFGNVSKLVNPQPKTKFQTLVDDCKDTAYTSYWKKPLGKVQDPIPMLPEGFDVVGTTMGKITPYHGRLYDLVMPKVPFPDNTPNSKKPGYQINRNYCRPDYNPELTFGYRTFVDKRGKYARCALTIDKKALGTSEYELINTVQSNFQDQNQAKIGKVSAPNKNIKEVPNGYSFGILRPPGSLPECLTYCDINPEKAFFMKCLGHLNSLRKCLSTRFLPNFFNNFYLNLKFYDKNKIGWLPKSIVYENCGIKFIRFDPSLIEPILSVFNAFDGRCIEYKTFVHIINYREPSPDFPKVNDLPRNCLDFLTIYTEMTTPGQKVDNRLMAGLPSGRYLDRDYPVTPENCCKAIRTCLPHESDLKASLYPSIPTLMFVSHRDMYANRDQSTVRRVFEASGEKFTDDRFNSIWEAAQKYHSQGWVCYETFRRALENIS